MFSPPFMIYSEKVLHLLRALDPLVFKSESWGKFPGLAMVFIFRNPLKSWELINWVNFNCNFPKPSRMKKPSFCKAISMDSCWQLEVESWKVGKLEVFAISNIHIGYGKHIQVQIKKFQCKFLVMCHVLGWHWVTGPKKKSHIRKLAWK